MKQAFVSTFVALAVAMSVSGAANAASTLVFTDTDATPPRYKANGYVEDKRNAFLGNQVVTRDRVALGRIGQAFRSGDGILWLIVDVSVDLGIRSRHIVLVFPEGSVPTGIVAVSQSLAELRDDIRIAPPFYQ